MLSDEMKQVVRGAVAKLSPNPVWEANTRAGRNDDELEDVFAAADAAIQAEREACAKIADGAKEAASVDIARRIRSRK